MTINGEAVAEVDVRASFITILYAMHKLDFDGDPYVIPGLGSEGRQAVKMFVAATIGNGAPIEKWSKKHAKDFFEDTSLRLQKRWPLSDVAQLTLKKHPLLRKLDEPIKGRKRDWSDLMWIESRNNTQGDAAMSATYGATWSGHTAASTRRVFSFFKRYWGSFQERRKRQRLRATLCDLSDRELMDIGTTRGEIDYVTSNRGIDPRGIRSAG